MVVVVRPAAGSIAGSILRYCLCSRCREGGGGVRGGDVPPGPVIQHSQYQPLHLIGTRDQEGARLVAVNTLSSRSMEVLAIMTLFIFKRIILIFEIKSNISFTDKNNINFVLY